MKYSYEEKLAAVLSVVNGQHSVIGYYVNYRQAIIEPNTDLYKLKQVYNQNPLKELKRNQKIKGK